MIKSKAVDIIKTLDKDEFKEFGKFVKSPFFNERKILVKIYDIFKSNYPDFSKKTFSKEHIYKKLFPGKKYKDATIRKYLSEMQLLAEEFLASINLRDKYAFHKDLALFTKLIDKKLYALFELNVARLDRNYKKFENINDDYFYRNFELEVLKINFTVASGKSGIDRDSLLTLVQKCGIYFICYSLIISLKLNQDLIGVGVNPNFKRSNALIYRFIESIGPDNFLEIFKSLAPEYYPIVAIYYNRYMIVAGYDKDDKFYWHLKELVLKYVSQFQQDEKYNLLLFLENSCTEKISEGKLFNKELLDTFNIMLSNELYVFDKSHNINLLKFRNIISNAISMNEIEWLEEFVKKYLERLPLEYRKNMINYTRAYLSFHKSDFERALEHISKVKPDFYNIKFDIWILKLQCEYELNYTDEALYLIDSYSHSLKSDSTSPSMIKSRFLAFLKFYRELLRLKDNQVRASEREMDLINLKDEIMNTSVLLGKEWLLNKIQFLSK